MAMWKSILVFLVVLVCLCESTPQVMSEYCEDDLFSAQCGEQAVVVILEALYGRMAIGECVTRDYGHMGCSIDVTQDLDILCSGRHACEVPVSDLIQSDRKPCPIDFRSYLLASYKCVPVLKPITSSCLATDILEVTQPAGYIASIVTEDTGCGGIDAPWILTLPRGSQINFTLWDFDLPPASSAGGGSSGLPSPCHVYAIIKETHTITASRTICSEGRRVSHVFTSSGNSVEVRIVTKRGEADRGSFMLEYNGIGCPDLLPPEGATFTRNLNSARISCQMTTEAWEIVCRNNAWSGTYGNCSRVPLSGGVSDSMWTSVTGSQGVSIAIIVGVAIIVGISIVVLGLFCLKWQRAKHATPYPPPPPSTYDRSMSRGYNSSTMPKDRGAIDPYEPNENNYYRTWQIQQRNSKPHIRNTELPPPPYYHQPSSNGSEGRGYHFVEHVYESPKFDHRDMPSSPSGDFTNGSAQYFELDPEVISSHSMPRRHDTVDSDPRWIRRTSGPDGMASPR